MNTKTSIKEYISQFSYTRISQIHADKGLNSFTNMTNNTIFYRCSFKDELIFNTKVPGINLPILVAFHDCQFNDYPFLLGDEYILKTVNPNPTTLAGITINKEVILVLETGLIAKIPDEMLKTSLKHNDKYNDKELDKIRFFRNSNISTINFDIANFNYRNIIAKRDKLMNDYSISQTTNEPVKEISTKPIKIQL